MPTTSEINSNKSTILFPKEIIQFVVVTDTYNSLVSQLSTIDGAAVDLSASSQKVKNYFQSDKWSILKKKLENYKTVGMFPGVNLYGIEQRLNKILKDVYSQNPSAVAVQATGEGSLLISFKIDRLTSYLEYFPDNSAAGVSEYILNSFLERKNVIDTYSGTLDSIINKIKITIYEANNHSKQELMKLVKENLFVDSSINNSVTSTGLVYSY